MRKRLTVLGSILVAFLLVAGTANASSTDAELTDEGQNVKVAAHKLKAKGKGNVAVEASGRLRISMRGSLEIVDNAGDAVVHIRARTADDEPDSDKARMAAGANYTLKGFNGVVWVSGSDFNVRLRGKVRKLVANGSGAITFDGRGLWWTRHHHGRWNMTVWYGGSRPA